MSNPAMEPVTNQGSNGGDIPPPRLLVIPDDADSEFAPPAPPSAPRAGWRPGRRTGTVGAVVLIAGAVLFGAPRWYPTVRGLWSSGRPAAPSSAAPLLPPSPSVSALADTLDLAVGSFELRARLFEGHQMQCTDLARGLILVEERWTAYSSAGASSSTLDTARDGRDRALYARVDGVERSFEHSACPRP